MKRRAVNSLLIALGSLFAINCFADAFHTITFINNNAKPYKVTMSSGLTNACVYLQGESESQINNGLTVQPGTYVNIKIKDLNGRVGTSNCHLKQKSISFQIVSESNDPNPPLRHITYSRSPKERDPVTSHIQWENRISVYGGYNGMAIDAKCDDVYCIDTNVHKDGKIIQITPVVQ